MQNSEMGIPLVIFSNEREIGFGHLALRPGNYSKIADASCFFESVIFCNTPCSLFTG
jgi:hypothetical protein